MSTLQDLFNANAEWVKLPLTNGTAISLAILIWLEIKTLVQHLERKQ